MKKARRSGLFLFAEREVHAAVHGHAGVVYALLVEADVHRAAVFEVYFGSVLALHLEQFGGLAVLYHRPGVVLGVVLEVDNLAVGGFHLVAVLERGYGIQLAVAAHYVLCLAYVLGQGVGARPELYAVDYEKVGHAAEHVGRRDEHENQPVEKLVARGLLVPVEHFVEQAERADARARGHRAGQEQRE